MSADLFRLCLVFRPQFRFRSICRFRRMAKDLPFAQSFSRGCMRREGSPKIAFSPLSRTPIAGFRQPLPCRCRLSRWIESAVPYYGMIPGVLLRGSAEKCGLPYGRDCAKSLGGSSCDWSSGSNQKPQDRSFYHGRCYMGSIADRWRECRSRESVQTFGGADHNGLPEISALLCGKANSQGTGWDRPPYSLLLFLEGDLVKFCFSAGDKNPKLWGTVKGLAEGLLAVEEALCREHCEWKLPKSTSNGFTHR